MVFPEFFLQYEKPGDDLDKTNLRERNFTVMSRIGRNLRTNVGRPADLCQRILVKPDGISSGRKRQSVLEIEKVVWGQLK